MNDDRTTIPFPADALVFDKQTLAVRCELASDIVFIWPVLPMDSFGSRNPPLKGTLSHPTGGVPPYGHDGTLAELQQLRQSIGNVFAREHNGRWHLVVALLAPPEEHIWIGPCDFGDVEQCVASLQQVLHLPQKLPMPRIVSAATLAAEPSAYHAVYIQVEGQWLPRREETPDFVASSALWCNEASPDKPVEVRVTGFWINHATSGELWIGSKNHLVAAEIEYLTTQHTAVERDGNESG